MEPLHSTPATTTGSAPRYRPSSVPVQGRFGCAPQQNQRGRASPTTRVLQEQLRPPLCILACSYLVSPAADIYYCVRCCRLLLSRRAIHTCFTITFYRHARVAARPRLHRRAVTYHNVFRRRQHPPTRHELARTLALEDGEPWRLAEIAAAKRGVESAGGVAPADVDRLRATAAGAAKLSRALAQGEVGQAQRACCGRVVVVLFHARWPTAWNFVSFSSPPSTRAFPARTHSLTPVGRPARRRR